MDIVIASRDSQVEGVNKAKFNKFRNKNVKLLPHDNVNIQKNF